jgi:nucleoid DNA-binding protein
MAKTNSLHENITEETVELFIRTTLLRGEKVIIPDFGHLELKSLGERRTVLFKPTDSNDSFLRVMSSGGEKDSQAIYTTISVPLKEGKVVNLPQIGVFRPVKRENGEVHISFIPSNSLRKLLNGEEKVEEIRLSEIKKEIKEEEIPNTSTYEAKNEVQEDEIITSKISLEKNEGEVETVGVEKNNHIASKFKSKLPSSKKNAQVGEVLVPDENDSTEKSKIKNISGVLLLVVAVVACVVILVSTIYVRYNKKIEERTELIAPQESTIDLPSLSEQHYGNAAFWIYIYEANKDKLDSPINIPKNVSLIIPDLKAEYDVDVTDSMEIRRANILADIVLKKRNN